MDLKLYEFLSVYQWALSAKGRVVLGNFNKAV